MKKTRLSVWILVLMMFMVTPAFAKTDKAGVYVGIKFIDSIQGHWAGVDGYDDAGGWQNTVGGGIFVGYDFYHKFDVPVRAELEYALRSDWTGDDNYYVGTDRVNLDTKVNVQTLLFNVYYDFRNSSDFTPYVGAGIGMAFARGFASADRYTAAGAYVAHASGEGYSTNFAWQVGAGVAYAITDTVSADLGYRYLGLGHSGDDIIGGFSGAHEFSLGIRFTF